MSPKSIDKDNQQPENQMGIVLKLVVIALAITSIFAVLVPSCTVQQPETLTLRAPVAQNIAPGQIQYGQIPPAPPVRSSTHSEIQLRSGFEYGYFVTGSEGVAHFVIDLTSQLSHIQAQRPPISVSLVIDRSGSMSGDKIRHAIAAASRFVQSLQDGDIVSIYQYDDVVNLLVSPTVINPLTRPGLLASIARITPRGGTNLHGGLVAGINGLMTNGTERPVRRVILISDGLANVGPSSPLQIGQEAAIGAMSGISVTSIGVGLDYDESVLGAVALRSGGRFYHLQQPSQLSAIMESELQALNQTVARNVIIELSPAPGVEFIGATGADILRQEGRITLRVGDMLGGISRPVVVNLGVPTGGSGPQSAGQIALSYTSVNTGQHRNATADLSYELTESQTQAAQSINPRFAVIVEGHRASMAQQQAAQLLEQGNSDGAGDVMSQQATALRQRAAQIGGSEGRELNRRAEVFERTESRMRKARSRQSRRRMSLQANDDALTGLGL